MGDVVVTDKNRPDGRLYILHRAGGRAQVIIQSREAALAEARLFAIRERVRAWIAHEQTFVLLEEYRSVQS